TAASAISPTDGSLAHGGTRGFAARPVVLAVARSGYARSDGRMAPLGGARLPALSRRSRGRGAPTNRRLPSRGAHPRGHRRRDGSPQSGGCRDPDPARPRPQPLLGLAAPSL